jgi:hypothetical protein
MSPIQSPAKSPQTEILKSTNENENENENLESSYQDHPDAPLPNGLKSDQSSSQDQNHDSLYRCESGSEASAQPVLAQSEPRPIDEDDSDDASVAASRPRHAWQVLWLRNKGMALVLLAQMFGASMNVMTQILEIHSAMHPFQVSIQSQRRSKPDSANCISQDQDPRVHFQSYINTTKQNPRSFSLACPSLQ